MQTEYIAQADSPAVVRSLPTWITLLLATACGMIVASLYYVQPLIGPISGALGLSPQTAGLIVTMTQIGYGLSLVLVVPLADVIENRRLIVAALAACTFALFMAGLANNASVFLLAMFCIGFSAVAAQIVMPYASHLVAPEARGRALGKVVSGLMLGIMLSRPAASFLTDVGSWRTVFVLAAAGMAVLAAVLTLLLPARRPDPGLSYSELLRSMLQLFLRTPLLRRRAFYHACLFGAFSLFWTTAPLWLASPAFHLSQAGIAWFALAGVAGAIAAPIAGRFADKGWGHLLTGLAILIVASSFLMMHAGGGFAVRIAMLVLSAVVLDFGVSMNFVIGQRAIFAMASEYRGRLNAIYIAIFFLGGAIGSAAGAWVFAQFGWACTAWLGFSLPAGAMLYYLTERS
ncbi:MFS transporter [Dyella sp. M7H15-1]|uniref:MFS transporter n=1 Tax=Dyella sp. M7H15-1 TaxID=2501295 RepID=UPI0010050E45|nr:MFS transporter [Dyella sp. M7H15-1]QAU22998.1 MFS transporter [Dyella sp. M7H15-1]